MPFSAVVFLRQTLGCLFGACLKGDTNGSGGDDADADANADGNDARGQGNIAGDNMEEISLMEHHRQQQQQVTRNRDPEIWHMVQLPPLPLNSRFRRGDRNASARRASTRRGLSLDSAVVSSTEKLQSSPDKSSSSSSSSTDKSSSDDVQNKGNVFYTAFCGKCFYANVAFVLI